MRFLLGALLFLAGCMLAMGEVLFTRTAAPKGWRLGERANPSSPMTLTLALKQRNLDALEAKFWAVSTPGSAQYQDFMTIDQIVSLVAPPASSVDAVTAWLESNGAKSYTLYGDAIEVKTTALVAEYLFDTLIYEYTHESTGKKLTRQFGTCALPAGIKQYVDMVFGLSSFPMPRYMAHKGSPNDNVGVIAQTLYGMYNISTETSGADVKITSQGVIEFEGQTFSPDDLAQYATLTGIKLTAVPDAQIVGPNDPSYGQVEATLDIDFIATVNIEASNWFWIEAGNNWLYAFAVHFFNTTSVPQVISISYGWWEGAQCDINPDECSQIGVDSHGYVSRVNTEFQKIGLRGISILVASGDSGAHTRTDEACTAPTLRAEFPAGSPYVTTVGATQLINAQPLASQPAACTQSGYVCAASGTEVAVSFDIAMFTSGGGFSEVAAQPDYQTAAVAAYLKSGVSLPPASYYNASNRAEPDVSALGHNNLIYDSGLEAVGGTSASAPIFAGVIALLNEVSLKKTQKTLGFANPLLYQMAAAQPNAFNDITSGDNKCTESGCSSGCQGWTATKGWDPVTGLGTPNVGNMIDYLNKNL